jgi:hypothetical protein
MVGIAIRPQMLFGRVRSIETVATIERTEEPGDRNLARNSSGRKNRVSACFGDGGATFGAKLNIPRTGAAGCAGDTAVDHNHGPLAIRVTGRVSTQDAAPRGGAVSANYFFLAPQGFAAPHGLLAPHGAQGLLAPHGAQGLFALQGLQLASRMPSARALAAGSSAVTPWLTLLA